MTRVLTSSEALALDSSTLEGLEELFGPVLSRYSRADALDDGALVDLSGRASAKGVRYPMAITCAAYGAICEGVKEADRPFRVDALVDAFKAGIRRQKAGCNRFKFTLMAKSGPVTLDAVCGPGDTMDPVLTLMLEGED